MEYEYKSINLSSGNELPIDSIELNTAFLNGWEYVDSICQSISSTTHGYDNTKYGSVIVILRRKKEEISL